MASETERAMQHRDRHRLRPPPFEKIVIVHKQLGRHERRRAAVLAKRAARDKARKED